MSTTIGQIEFELEKAEHGMGLPYDAERVGQLRNMLREARKRKFVSRAGGETRTAPTLSSALAAFNRRRFMIIRGIAATPGTPIFLLIWRDGQAQFVTMSKR